MEKYEQHLHSFRAFGTIEIIAVETFDQLPRESNWNKFNIVVPKH